MRCEQRAHPHFAVDRSGQLVEINGGDHLFSAPGGRQRLFEESTKYLVREFPLPSALSSVTASDRGPNGQS